MTIERRRRGVPPAGIFGPERRGGAAVLRAAGNTIAVRGDGMGLPPATVLSEYDKQENRVGGDLEPESGARHGVPFKIGQTSSCLFKYQPCATGVTLLSTKRPATEVSDIAEEEFEQLSSALCIEPHVKHFVI
ncbi:MAG: hypothetical protein AAF718_10070 [Pseudomonadota bacterium]